LISSKDTIKHRRRNVEAKWDLSLVWFWNVPPALLSRLIITKENDLYSKKDFHFSIRNEYELFFRCLFVFKLHKKPINILSIHLNRMSHLLYLYAFIFSVRSSSNFNIVHSPNIQEQITCWPHKYTYIYTCLL
jgi:hypothetical protein